MTREIEQKLKKALYKLADLDLDLIPYIEAGDKLYCRADMQISEYDDILDNVGLEYRWEGNKIIISIT